MIYRIGVPDYDDSISLATIGEHLCRLRFRWDSVGEYWEFGVYDQDYNPVFIGVKMVPDFPINLFSGHEEFSEGYFYVETNEPRLTRNSFKNGLATFNFGVIPSD